MSIPFASCQLIMVSVVMYGDYYLESLLISENYLTISTGIFTLCLTASTVVPKIKSLIPLCP